MSFIGCVAEIFPSYLLKFLPKTSTWICIQMYVKSCRYVFKMIRQKVNSCEKSWRFLQENQDFVLQIIERPHEVTGSLLFWQIVLAFLYFVSTYVMMTEWFQKFRIFHTKNMTLGCSTNSRNLSFKWTFLAQMGPPVA